MKLTFSTRGNWPDFYEVRIGRDGIRYYFASAEIYNETDYDEGEFDWWYTDISARRFWSWMLRRLNGWQR